MNGERNGKGKEYVCEKILFEGEYLNGKGKEYYNNNKPRFKGEYLNGKWWNGKIYDNKNRTQAYIKNGKDI